MPGLPCDTCSNNVYDDEAQCYMCQVNMDEDEIYRIMSMSRKECPFYSTDDDYFLARKQ